MPAPDPGEIITAQFSQAAAEGFARIREFGTRDDVPVEYARAKILEHADSLTRAADQALAQATELRAQRHDEADRLYADDPHGPEVDAARSAMLLEADQLARGMSPLQGRNLLFPQAWEFVRLGNYRRAEVYARAGYLAGAQSVELMRAIDALKAADVAAYPNRAQATQLRALADRHWTEAKVATATAQARLANLLSRGSAAASASISAKLTAAGYAAATGQQYRGRVGIEGPLDDERGPER